LNCCYRVFLTAPAEAAVAAVAEADDVAEVADAVAAAAHKSEASFYNM
jgi:hypothetical protein